MDTWRYRAISQIQKGNRGSKHWISQLMEYECDLMGKNSWSLSDYQEFFKGDFIEY
jgi:hypothetical protein